MLQPRKRKFTLKITPKGLLLCVIILLTFTQNLDYVKGEDERNGSIKEKIRRGERVIRHGDVNIVVLDDLDRRKLTPSVGLLSTTARTFIQEGTTTEYATHIYGTTVGDKYAHIVSTGSKIFYDNVRPTKEKFDPMVTIPSLDSLIFPSEEHIIILPTRVAKEKHVSEKIVTPNKEDVSYKNIDSLKANIPSISEKTPVTVNKSTSEEKRSNFISIKKEISIKPAKVKLKNELPTFTIKQDSAEIETKIDESFSSSLNDNSLRSAKNVPHKPVAKTPELTTTTYFGFADFVTTAGNTVIIFTPKTQKPNYEGSVTSIPGEPTLSGVSLSTAVYSVPTTTSSPVTTESEEEVTEPHKIEYEITTVKEVNNDDEHADVVTTPEVPDITTELNEVTTESIISSTNVDDLVKNNLDVPFIENNDSLESSFAQDINPTSATDVYKTLTYVTTFYLSSKNGQTGTSIRSDTVVLSQSTEDVTTEITTQSGTTEMEEDTTESDEDVTTVESITEKVAIKNKPEVPSTNKPEEHSTDKPEVPSTDKPDIPATDKPVIPATDKPAESIKESLDELISTTSEPDVEVELIFKTLYTTYTYLTTFFEKSTTRVKSREEVVTNVVTSTVDNAFWQLATDPAVAGLFSSGAKGSYREAKVLPSTVGVGRPTASFDTHHAEIAPSNFDIDNEITKPTPTLESHLARSSVKTKYTTYTAFSTMVKDDKTVVMNNTEVYTNVINPSLSALSKSTTSAEIQVNGKDKVSPKLVILKHTSPNSYKTTIKRIRPTSTELTNDVQETKKEGKNDTGKLRDSIVSEEMSFNSVIISAPLTNDVSLITTKKSTEQTPKKVYLDNDNDDDQLSQESNTEETHPNPSLISLQTSYTTYTYFTTLYKGTTSEVVSRLETVTNVNTELIKPSSTESIQTEEATAPVTYYTTYTYWTTFYKDGSTMIKSRQETVSNVAQPTPTSTQVLKTEITPTKEPFTEPVTYYTTFTYFTTSYIGNSSVVNSHLDTVTNVIDATKAAELLDTNTFESSTNGPIFQPTGLISTTVQTQVNDNLTTLFSTNTYGTYVDGVYSQVLESTSSIVTGPINQSSTPALENLKPTGLVSVNEGKIVDAFNITTTLYTTKVIGTYIEKFYAQLIESTSSVNINTEKLSNLVNPSTVVLNDRIYQTGVLQLTEGSIVKDKTTTYYETKVVGSVIDDRYSSITETSSSVFVQIVPTKTNDIKATATADLSTASPSTLVSTSPSPAVIESSLNENSNENDSDEDKDKTRRKSFTPVIRPFASRSRPTFLPKKKTSEPLSAATITRGITPTVVALPAVKTTEPRFGSANRNRFASSRKSSSLNSPSSEVRPATPNSRRFSKGKPTASNFIPSSSQFSKSSSTKLYSSSSAVPNYKRGSYRPTSLVSTRSVDYLSSTPGSRFRIRPTASGRIAGFSPSTTPRLEEIESSESGFTEQALSSSDEEVVETLPPITTESSRRGNPLLRFRKPAAPRNTTPISTTVRSTTPRKNSARKANEGKITTTKAPTTTKPSRPRTPSSINNRFRQKSSNSLFPTKPTFKKTELESESEEENGEQEPKQEQNESSEEVTENLEALSANSITERSTKKSSLVSIKPFPNRRGRVKRQSEFGYKYENIRGQSSRYRRPTQNSFPDYLYYDDVEYTTEDVAVRSVSNRNVFKSRNTQQVQQPYQQYQQYQQPLQYQQTYQSTTQAQVYQSPKIRPSTTVASNSRAQFTLREKTQTTTSAPQRTNRRTTTASYRKYMESSTKRPSQRSRAYTTTTEVSSYRNNRKQSTGRRTTSRSRYKDNDFNANTYSPTFDGTITVTHKIPTEVTIPVFNGKSTEYKNVVTAKPSLQTLGPHQYTTITGKNGATTLQLVNEVTETLLNGATEITRFVIQEFPTTTVTFTPTTIRGRKTSFSHVIPSTVYEIKPEISTIQPQLNANAPLANLLLSQLLLGNLGIQPTINPLLGLNQASAAPVTEFKTKTTSYVTTITHSTSTVIPVTFRGKEIKTTVIDSSTQVITATEYITETIVISPTQTAPSNNQFNTLLLPALLQAQLLNQPQPSTTSSPIDENIADNLQLIQDAPSPSKVVKNGLNVDSEKDEDYLQKDTRKKQKGKPFDSGIEPAETSVVTLYVSGRRPGEFSTVLSTVTLDEKSATLRKRNADISYDVKPSAVPSLSSSFNYEDYFDEVIKSGINDIAPSEADQETQSLDSIMGDFGKRLSKQKTEKNHFLLKTSTESAPFRWNSNLTRSFTSNVKFSSDYDLPKVNLGRKLLSIEDDDDAFPVGDMSSMFQISADDKSSPVVEDEGRGRYNLATKVMSNGVEVIVALDKSTLPGSPQLLRVLPTSNIRPITLTPSTVTDHMIMMLPHGLQDDPNPLVTKTYVTTYTYLTTFLQEGETTTSSKEKVVSNVLTENINLIPTTSPNADAHVTLSSSPILATKVLQTTYAMESTVTEGSTPHVVTSQQTVANTITAPGGEYAQHLLQSSEPSYVETNSIFSKEPANEDYTIKPTEKLSSELHLKNSDKNTIEVKPTSLQTADVTKTYFVTYTYFSTLLENGTTVVKSNIATSSDVVTEKVYMPLKRTKYPTVKETQTTVYSTDMEKPISIFATKTYLTTFTYFTTLLQDKGGKAPQTVIRSRTKVMQNLVTETLNTNLLNSDYLLNLKHSLRKESLPITATATLNDGQKLEITAVNENNNIQTNNIDRISSSIEESQDYYNQVDANPNQPVKQEVSKPSGTINKLKDTNFTTTVLQSSTVIKSGATLFPGSQVIKFTDKTGNVSIIPVSDPVSKHPDGSHHKPENNKIQMNNLLNFGTLGINSLSALKPVINAMAGLWQNNIKTNVKDKNEQHHKYERPYVDKHPLAELSTNLKPPNRTPIYIPVGSANDNEEAESEDMPEQYPDVNQRNNHHHIALSKPAIEKPLLSGGISISPGQVITANTDVIVGTPAVHGPRPPLKNSNEKSDVPIGMKPPPLSVGHYSEDEIDKVPPFHEMPKVPPKPLSPAFLNNGFPNNFKFPPKNHYKYNDQKIPLSSEIKYSQLPLNTPLLHRDQVKEQTALGPPVKLSHPMHIEHSSLNPLLVNVRPSQVAQVVIPHGSQTALIYSDEPSTYNTKGEIFNDPSPYPEANVNPGFVGLNVYGPVGSSQEGTSKLASNTIHLDIPIDPYAADGALTESHHFIVLGSDGKPQPPYNIVNSVLKAPQNESDFSIFKRLNSKYNFTTPQTHIDFIKKPARPTWHHNHPEVIQHPGTEQKQRPFIFPQNKPLPEGNHYHPVRPDSQNGNNFVGSEGDNEAADVEDDSSEDDEITQETKLKPSSNQQSNEFNSASATISVSGNDNLKESGEEALHDYEINQNWEIMREKPEQTPKAKPTQTPKGDNSTTRENPNIKYSEWTSMEFPTFGNEVNVTSHPQIDHNAVANLEKENASTNKNVNQKPSSHNRNNQDDVVIGMSPPPLPRPSTTPLKPARPSLKPYEPKGPQRPSVKNKPKPTNPPYPFEKPTPTSVTKRPQTTISKPPPNILYETDPPNFAEEILKMKPLNTTGRIEPVKKWQTTTKPTGLHPVYGNVVKVTDVEKVNEKPTRSSNHSDTITSQSDTRIFVVDKPEQEKNDKTTELISKWNENGFISSSKNDVEDPEYKNTPTLITTNRTKAGTATNTIFGNLYTRPPPANIVIIPTHSTTQHYTAISMVIDQEPTEHSTRPSHETTVKPDIKPTSALVDGQTKQEPAEKKEDGESRSTAVPTYYITHTKTLSVTITQTTVVQRDGQPSTHTVVLTKTQTSTLIDTVTKIQTLLQPTSVLSTITTTIPVTVSKEPPYSTVTPSDYSNMGMGDTRAGDNDSIFVVMSDKKSGSQHIVPVPTDARPTSFEVQVPDEANEISPNDILYSGIFTQHNDNECRPECKITKNEVCQKVDSTMRCICRPGFARMFPDHPCKSTYTYVMRLPLDRQGEEEIRYTDGLADRTSPSHQQLTEATRDGLDRMVMQSNLRDIYHGIVVSGFEPAKQSDKAAVVYMVQLSENPEEIKLLEEVHKTLKANNYSLGGTDVFAAPDMFHFIQAEDFDECSDNKYHDCSEHAQCFNLRGTYTCSCKEGYTDMSYNTQFPGRVCSADAIGCELCNYHGTCYYKANEDPTCECFQWYAGEFCQINLKVTLISLIAIGVLLSILLVVCVVMTCNKQKPPEILRTAPKPHVGFRRYRSVTNVPGDKRAIVSVDTSSEGSIERTPPPFIKQRVLRNEPPNAPSSHGGGGTVQSTEQRDRSLTVLIPRAKYRPVSSQPSSTLLTMSTFGPEQKLLNYAGSRESSRTPEKKMSRCSMHSRRLSNSTNLSAEPQPRKKMSAPRRPSSGALVSAGFEVSATVRRTQELGEAYISQSHNDLNQPTYNSIRTAESSIIVDVPSLPVFESSLEEFITRVDKLGTVSEARSYDETTIQPPMRSLHHVFHSQMHTCGSKNSSSHKTNLDEHHTMGERDLGSTYMPKSQLYKPDLRESDGSNFDSL